MGTIKTKGIVIAEHNVGDFDKILTILTPEMGKISCSARGARRPKSSLLAGSQWLCFGDYILYKGPKTYSINSCDIIESFYNIRTDLDKLTYSAHITKIISDVTSEEQPNHLILQLFLNTIYTISETNKNVDLILAVFKIKLMCLLGYTPTMEECAKCMQKTVKIKEVSKDTEKAINYIIKLHPKEIYSFTAEENTIKELETISAIYMNKKLEKEYKLEKLV